MSGEINWPIPPENPNLKILEGHTLADNLREELKQEAADFEQQYDRPPGLAMIVLGGDRTALDYAEGAAREARKIGIEYMAYLWPEETSDLELQLLIRELNSRTLFDGIAIQAPLPSHISYEKMIAAINPDKDVEGYHPLNVGRLFSNLDTFVPPPAVAAMELLLRYDINPSGTDAVVIGRSRLVGKPIAGLLVIADATVTVCHSQSQNLNAKVRAADLVLSCAGQPGLVTGDMIKPGAIVLDFSRNYDEDGKVVGDVEWESVSKVAGAISPVTGGSTPVTVLALLANTIKAARRLRLQ
jgi:methylenetetrahydrofolate dehydrogenase (NADP+)/methenyltetrahydrofolate cyclohydrolase